MRCLDTTNSGSIGSETSLPGENIRYSLPWLNTWTGHTRGSEADHQGKNAETDPSVNFVKFGWETKGKVRQLVGVEDGTDHDMNDIMFLANGKFVEDQTVLKPGDTAETFEEEPEVMPNSWIVAVEDLGDTDDFDYNDIVFKVEYVAGQSTATVTPLAAGGTLPAYIMFGDQDLGEIHSLFGTGYNSNIMINTGSGPTATGNAITINVDPDTFSMATNMGGFSVKVRQSAGEFTTIECKTRTDADAINNPWIFCLEESWAWPLERHDIKDAYGDFTKWFTENKTDWHKSNVNEGHIFKH